MTTEQDNRRAAFEAINGGTLSKVREVLHPEYEDWFNAGYDAALDYAKQQDALAWHGWQPIVTQFPNQSPSRELGDVLAVEISTGIMKVSSMDQYDMSDPDSHYYSESPEWYPTHWQPLPTPPQSDKNDA